MIYFINFIFLPTQPSLHHCLLHSINTLICLTNVWQSLLALEPEYLAMLVTENGQLSINKDAMVQLINAQIEEANPKNN